MMRACALGWVSLALASALGSTEPVPTFREVFMLTRDVLLPTLDLVQKLAPDLFSRHHVDPEQAKKSGEVPRAFALDALEVAKYREPGHHALLSAALDAAAKGATPRAPRTPRPKVAPPEPATVAAPAPPPSTSPGVEPRGPELFDDTEPPPPPDGMDAE